MWEKQNIPKTADESSPQVLVVGFENRVVTQGVR